MAESKTVLSFDGVNDFIVLADNPKIRIAAYTAEVWVKLKRGKNDGWRGVLGKPGRNFHIWLHSDGFVHHRFHSAVGTNDGAPNTAAGLIQPDRWYHIAITHDGKTASTYVDGELRASGPTNGAPVVDATQLYVATNADNGSGNRFCGQLAELRLFSRARTQAEIKASMSQRLNGDEAGLVLYWPLTNGEARDATGNENHGTVHATCVTDESFPVVDLAAEKAAAEKAAAEKAAAEQAAAEKAAAEKAAAEQAAAEQAAAEQAAAEADKPVVGKPDAGSEPANDAAPEAEEPAPQRGISDRALSNVTRLAGDVLLVPGTSLILNGDVKGGAIRAAAGILARMWIGPVGWFLVAADAFGKSTTGAGLVDRIRGKR